MYPAGCRLASASGLCGLSHLLISQCEVVMRVGVGGSQLNRNLVSLHRFLHPSSFVEHVAQVEIGERITGSGFDGAAVVLFRMAEFLPVVIQRAQIDMRRGVRGSSSKTLWYAAMASGCVLGFSSRAMPRANRTDISCSCGVGSDRGTGVVVTTFSRSEKSIRNCPAIGSRSLPWCRKATRFFVVDQVPASSRGFSIPAACLRMASSDSRITLGRTLIAQRSRIFLISSRSEKL